MLDLGGLPGFSIAATIWAGLAFVNLSTLGSTYAANISGEIKKVNIAMPLAQLGSMALFVVYWILFTSVANHGLGENTIRSLATLESTGRGQRDARHIPDHQLHGRVDDPELVPGGSSPARLASRSPPGVGSSGCPSVRSGTCSPSPLMV